MRKTILTAALLASINGPAQAREWWGIYAYGAQCVAPAEWQARYPFAATPDVYNQTLRNRNIIPKIEIVRDKDGNVRQVMVKGKTGSVVFATSAEACKEVLEKLIKDGAIVCPNELR